MRESVKSGRKYRFVIERMLSHGRASPHPVATRRSPKKRQIFDALPLKLATVYAFFFFQKIMFLK